MLLLEDSSRAWRLHRWGSMGREMEDGGTMWCRRGGRFGRREIHHTMDSAMFRLTPRKEGVMVERAPKTILEFDAALIFHDFLSWSCHMSERFTALIGCRRIVQYPESGCQAFSTMTFSGAFSIVHIHCSYSQQSCIIIHDCIVLHHITQQPLLLTTTSPSPQSQHSFLHLTSLQSVQICSG